MSLKERDKKHLWHPLTQHKTAPEMMPIVRAKGALLFDEGGKEYIDGISSWYTCMYGHCNPYILKKVTSQMKELDHIVFSGFTHKPAIELSEKLISILPKNQQKLFFSDNGSTATEVGIKMALQYHSNLGNKRTKMLAFENGFHGDTFGAMSVSGLSVYNSPFETHFIAVERIPVPNGGNNEAVLQKLKEILTAGDIAGFIYEPLVQGAAAMQMHDAVGLNEMLRICREHGVVTIADEVMTGFGKTGKAFASDFLTEKPDIICLSKALTAGLMPMAITSCSQEIYDAFYDDDIAKGLFHGHTYTANPLACTAASAGIDLLLKEKTHKKIIRINSLHRAFEKKIKEHPKVSSTRILGVIFAVDLNMEMSRYGDLRNRIFEHFMDAGVFLRPLGNTIYILPPYTISEAHLKKIYCSIEAALEKF